jgi:fructosamine-3-kinase
MKNWLDMNMSMTKEKQILNPLEVHKIVSENVKNILEEAGIPTGREIDAKEVRGEDSNSVFRIDCGSSSYALKVFSDSNDTGQFYTNIIFNQLLLENNIPTPNIIQSSDDLDMLPAPYIVWEWFDGKPSCDIGSEKERHDIAVQTGRQLRKIHEIKIPGYGHPDIKNDWSGENIKSVIHFFVKRIQNLIKKEGTAFSNDEFLDILRVTAESEKLLSFTEPRLLHGDITGGNIIVSDSKDISFIDPGEIIAGDPMSDLGYSQTTRLSPIFRKGLWEGYTKDNPLTDKEYDRFLRWRLLRQCVIVCRAFLNKDKNTETYFNDALSFLAELKK